MEEMLSLIEKKNMGKLSLLKVMGIFFKMREGYRTECDFLVTLEKVNIVFNGNSGGGCAVVRAEAIHQRDVSVQL